MKKKNKGKKYKDFDLDEYIKKQNNKSCSKLDKQENNINSKNNQKQKISFKNPLEKLVFYFPNFSRDLVEDVYNENNQNYSRSKDALIKLSEEENDENKINDHEMQIEEEEHTHKKKSGKKKKYEDISEYSNFNVVASFEDIEDDDKKEIHYINDDEEEKEKNFNNKNNEIKNEIRNNDNNSEYNKLLSIKEKNGKEYSSVFNNDDFDNNLIINTPNSNIRDEPMIDDYLFEQNIEFLYNCFPEYTREEIVKKICDLNFDINNVVSNILNEKYQRTPNDEDNKNFLEEDEIEAILANYEDNEEEMIDDDFIKFQKNIEDSIKIENINKKNNIYADEDYDMKKNDNDDKTQEKEEDFLSKKIDDIQTPQIRNDLKKLINNFPKEDEYTLKLFYLSSMDYKTTFDIFDKKDGTKNLELKMFMNNLKNKNNEPKSHKSNKPKKINQYISEDEKRRRNILKNILENKPINWNLEKEKNINEKDFVAIRNRLYKEAQNFRAAKKYSTGNLLLNKAKRYQQEIESIARNRGINTFFNNNGYNNNSKQIDLHGLTVPDSKYIVETKIEQLRKKKMEDNLKCISLTIITGRGSHSYDGKSALFHGLIYWLNDKDKIKADGREDEGVIIVHIY